MFVRDEYENIVGTSIVLEAMDLFVYESGNKVTLYKFIYLLVKTKNELFINSENEKEGKTIHSIN